MVAGVLKGFVEKERAQQRSVEHEKKSPATNIDGQIKSKIRTLDLVQQILVDSKRNRYCSLLLNYFFKLGGIKFMGENLAQIIESIKVAHKHYQEVQAEVSKEKQEDKGGDDKGGKAELDLKLDGIIELNPFKCQRELANRKSKDEKKEEGSEISRVIDQRYPSNKVVASKITLELCKGALYNYIRFFTRLSSSSQFASQQQNMEHLLEGFPAQLEHLSQVAPLSSIEQFTDCLHRQILEVLVKYFDDDELCQVDEKIIQQIMNIMMQIFQGLKHLNAFRRTTRSSLRGDPDPSIVQ